MIILSY